MSLMVPTNPFPAILRSALVLLSLWSFSVQMKLHHILRRTSSVNDDALTWAAPIDMRLNPEARAQVEEKFVATCEDTGLSRYPNNRLVMAYHPSKLFMSVIPKAGATLAVQIIFRHAGYCDDEGSDNGGNATSLCGQGVEIHAGRNKVRKENPDFKQTNCSMCSEPNSEWTCVKLVRSPLDRVVSSYLHVMKYNLYAEWPALKSITQRSGRDASNATFAEFLQAAGQGQKIPYGDHYLPQSRRGECLENLVLLPTESIEDSVKYIDKITHGRIHLNASGLSSDHYIAKNEEDEEGRTVIDATQIPYRGRNNLPSQNYESYLQNHTLNQRICQLFCLDFHLYAKACSQPWVRDQPVTLAQCIRERARVSRICGPHHGALYAV